MLENIELIKKFYSDNVIQINGEIPDTIPNGAILDIERKKAKNHVIHSYPAKFIPEIPRWIIKNYTEKNNIILDPFCGSGTTLVESIINKRNSIGYDINPIARLISKVKTTKLNIKNVNSERTKLSNRIKNFDKKDIESPYIPNKNIWFSNIALETLSIIKNSIDLIDDIDIRDFYLCCFSSIISRVSTVGSGQILQARRKNYQIKKELNRNEIIELFFTTCDNILSSLIETFDKIDESNFCHVLNMDARQVDDIDYNIDIIITSPPYINSIDYIWADKLRLHWMNFCKNDKERLKLMQQQIGTENIPLKLFRYVCPQFGILNLDEKLELIYNGTNYTASKNQNKLRAYCTYKFFTDMKDHLEKASKILSIDSYYCLVIGDNNICKVKIETPEFLETIAEEFGFVKEFGINVILKNRTLSMPRNVKWADSTMFDRILILKKVS